MSIYAIGAKELRVKKLQIKILDAEDSDECTCIAHATMESGESFKETFTIMPDLVSPIVASMRRQRAERIKKEEEKAELEKKIKAQRRKNKWQK